MSGRRSGRSVEHDELSVAPLRVPDQVEVRAARLDGPARRQQGPARVVHPVQTREEIEERALDLLESPRDLDRQGRADRRRSQDRRYQSHRVAVPNSCDATAAPRASVGGSTGSASHGATMRRLFPDGEDLALDELYAGLDPAVRHAAGRRVALGMVSSVDGAAALAG
jgi:hypothetical protein